MPYNHIHIEHEPITTKILGELRGKLYFKFYIYINAYIVT